MFWRGPLDIGRFCNSQKGSFGLCEFLQWPGEALWVLGVQISDSDAEYFTNPKWRSSGYWKVPDRSGEVQCKL